MTSPDGKHPLPPGPWDDPQGPAAFEQWIAETTAKLNAVDGMRFGHREYNLRKPWSFDRFGNTIGSGIAAAYAPDDWEWKYGKNRYRRMWDLYVPRGLNGGWQVQGSAFGIEWDSAPVESIRVFIENYLAQGR